MPSLIANTWNSDRDILGLILDYDGTLTPLVSDPACAVIAPEHLHRLKTLCEHPKIALAVLSGRSVKQLVTFLPSLNHPKVIFCGLHGGQIYHPHTETFLASPEETSRPDILQKFRKELLKNPVFADLLAQGVFLEDKDYSLALHLRRATASAKAKAIDLFHQQVSLSQEILSHYRVQPGKEVLELLPGGFEKGKCVMFLHRYWQRLGEQQLVYAGDDLTDESAFEAVNALGGLSICIGTPLHETQANFTLSSVEAFYDELAVLLPG